jgi:hypothetical protein
MTMTTRRTWLDRVLGKEKAEEVRSDVQQAAAVADEAGMERKDLTKAIPEEEQTAPAPVAEAPAAEAPPVADPEPEAAPGDPVQEAALKLAEQVMVAVPDLSTLTVEKLQAVIAEALQPAPEPVAEAAAPTPEAPVPPDEMQEDKALGVVVVSTPAQTKALDLITQMVTDQGEIAKSVTDLMEDVKTVKALTPIVEELARTMQEMQEQFSLRPRSASESDENVLDVQGKSKAAKTAQAIEADINKGLRGDTQKVLGVRVNG